MIRNKAWFFENAGPVSSNGKYQRFKIGHEPSEATFRDLLDSVVFVSGENPIPSGFKIGKIIFSDAGLTVDRTFTFPDLDGQVGLFNNDNGTINPSFTIGVGSVNSGTISTTGLTGARNYTLPNLDGELAILNRDSGTVFNGFTIGQSLVGNALLSVSKLTASRTINLPDGDGDLQLNKDLSVTLSDNMNLPASGGGDILTLNLGNADDYSVKSYLGTIPYVVDLDDKYTSYIIKGMLSFQGPTSNVQAVLSVFPFTATNPLGSTYVLGDFMFFEHIITFNNGIFNLISRITIKDISAGMYPNETIVVVNSVPYNSGQPVNFIMRATNTDAVARPLFLRAFTVQKISRNS